MYSGLAGVHSAASFMVCVYWLWRYHTVNKQDFCDVWY